MTVETGTGERYIHFTGQNISRDSSIDIRLARVSGNSSFVLMLSIIIIAVVIAAAVFFLVKRKRSGGQLQGDNDGGEEA